MSNNYRIPSDYQNDVPRSVHRWRSPVHGTLHPGLAYPVKWRHLDPGDRVRCKPGVLIQSQPMLGPLLNGFKFVTIATFTPDSVIYGWKSSGVRYTPQEYLAFNHFFFNPARPSGNEDRQAVPQPGVTLLSDTPNKYVRFDSMGLGLGPRGLDGWRDDQRYYSDPSTGELIENEDIYYHIGRGGLLDWLGLPPGAVAPLVRGPRTDSDGLFVAPDSFNFRAESLFAYFLSVYYYFANMQEEPMYFTKGAAHFPEGGVPTFSQLFQSFDPSNVLRYIAALRLDSLSPNYYADILDSTANNYSSVIAAMVYAGVTAHGGLLSVPYSPDFFNNIIKLGDSPTVNIPLVTDEKTGDVSGVAVPDLRFQTKIQAMIDRLFVSGGRPGDILRTLWGKKSNPYFDKPEFLGIWQSAINPSNIVATSNGEADGESVTTGQMTAHVDKWSEFGGSSGIDFTAKDSGTLMFVSVLVPEPSYCQGMEPGAMGISFADDFNPEMNGIGFVSAPRGRYTMMPSDDGGAGPTSHAFDYVLPDSVPDEIEHFPFGAEIDPNSVSVGDVVAWDYYKTDFSRLHGEFATNGVFSYWVLARHFSELFDPVTSSLDHAPSIVRDNFSTYINPLAWQYVFTAQSVYDPNFFFVGNFDLNVVSKVSSSYMPYLGH